MIFRDQKACEKWQHKVGSNQSDVNSQFLANCTKDQHCLSLVGGRLCECAKLRLWIDKNDNEQLDSVELFRGGWSCWSDKNKRW